MTNLIVKRFFNRHLRLHILCFIKKKHKKKLEIQFKVIKINKILYVSISSTVVYFINLQMHTLKLLETKKASSYILYIHR